MVVLVLARASAEIRRNEIENRLKRGLPVNATALAEEFLVSEDAVRRARRSAFSLLLWTGQAGATQDIAEGTGRRPNHVRL
jgi:hypothetical protein